MAANSGTKRTYTDAFLSDDEFTMTLQYSRNDVAFETRIRSTVDTRHNYLDYDALPRTVYMNTSVAGFSVTGATKVKSTMYDLTDRVLAYIKDPTLHHWEHEPEDHEVLATIPHDIVVAVEGLVFDYAADNDRSGLCTALDEID